MTLNYTMIDSGLNKSRPDITLNCSMINSGLNKGRPSYHIGMHDDYVYIRVDLTPRWIAWLIAVQQGWAKHLY